MAKVINVFYNAQGLPFKDKELTTHFPIVGGAFQGADNTTEIRFYVDNLGANRQWCVFGKLPNGKKGFKVLTESVLDEDEDRYYPFLLSQFFTQYKGDLYLSLGGYYGNIVELNEEQEYELQQVSGEMTGAIKLNIAYSVQMEGSDYDELPQWLQALASKLDTNKGIVVIPNPNATITGYQAGQYFYSQSDKTIYELVNSSLSYVVDLAKYENEEEYIAKLNENNTFTGDSTFASNPPIISMNIGMQQVIDPKWAVNKEYVDKLEAKSDVVDVVGTYTDLQVYDTSDLADNDVVKVLKDSTHENATTYYRWVITNNVGAWTYVGQDNVYSKEQTDTLLNNKQDKLTAGANIDITGNVIKVEGVYSDDEVDELLDDKQDKLVSGSNIKTINNESILGSGNINVQASSSWGNIGGNINNQTDLQNEFQDVREVAEGKNKSIVISYTLNIEIIKRNIGYGGTAILPDGTDITTNVLNGEYDNLIKNSLFNSESIEIRFGAGVNPGYIVEIQKNKMSLRDIFVFYNTSEFPTLKQGDVIFVIETDVPDRWISFVGYPYISLFKLETTKVDLSGYAQLSGNNTWTGTNTFDDVKIETLVVGKFNDPNSDAYFQIGNGRSDYLHNVISVEKYGIWVGGGYSEVNRWITWDKIREVMDNINNDNFVLKASLLASDGDINDIFWGE